MKTYGVFDVTIKAVDPADPNGRFEAILSAPTVDRDGEIIDAGAFNPLPDHIPIDIDHGMSVSTTVGSGRPFYEGDVLRFEGAFSSIPRAQEVRVLVAEGHVRKMSVAFMNARREVDPDDERPHIRQAELLNAAIVPIPSNRDADILLAKALAGESTVTPIEVREAAGLAPVSTPAPEDAPAPAAAPRAQGVATALADLAEAESLLT